MLAACERKDMINESARLSCASTAASKRESVWLGSLSRQCRRETIATDTLLRHGSIRTLCSLTYIVRTGAARAPRQPRRYNKCNKRNGGGSAAR